jgi:hypothetical protein
MMKSEILMNRLNRAEVLIEEARRLVESVIDEDENGDGFSAGKFMKTCDDLVDLVNELGYEIVMPLEMEEQE